MALETLAPGHRFADDESIMHRALQIALQGRGRAEPNPLVGAVIVDHERRFIAEGWHACFGSDHAEIAALKAVASASTVGMRLFVTLEPCSHHGKTPPCADAVIAAGFQEVVIGCQDPASHVSGQGISRLRDAGISVVTGFSEPRAQELLAPFSMLQQNQRPWVHAKWAMTLDGRVAASSGHSQWITCEQSREEVHQLRGMVDAVVTGAGTVRSDDPRLTARPVGPRTATRVVLDGNGTSIHAESQLVKTVAEAPLIVCLSDGQPDAVAERIQNLGAEVLRLPADSAGRLCVRSLLKELGRREMTHVLVEAGGGVMGAFFDAESIDEVHVFVAPKLVGGSEALSPVGGTGRDLIPKLSDLSSMQIERFDDDVLIRGRVVRAKLST